MDELKRGKKSQSKKTRSLHKKGKKQRFRLQFQTETVRYVNTFMRMVSISIEVHRPSSMRKKKKSRKLKSAHGRRRELNDRDDRKKSLQLKWDLPIANMPIARTWIWRNKESYLASQFGQQHNQIMKLCIWLFLLLFWLDFLFFQFPLQMPMNIGFVGWLHGDRQNKRSRQADRNHAVSMCKYIDSIAQRVILCVCDFRFCFIAIALVHMHINIKKWKTNRNSYVILVFPSLSISRLFSLTRAITSAHKSNEDEKCSAHTHTHPHGHIIAWSLCLTFWLECAHPVNRTEKNTQHTLNRYTLK